MGNNYWIVTIVCEYKNGKIEEQSHEVTGPITNASRLINTFKPKRGWKAIAYRIDQFDGLV